MAKDTKDRKTEASEQEKKKLPEQLEEFRKALEEEINTIERDGLSSTLLRRGRPLSNDGVSNRYSFDVDYLPAMPADTPCKLIVGKNTYEVTVISVEESRIIVAASSPLPPSIEQARLENGATVLLERLIKRIEDNSEKSNPAADRLLSQPASFKTIHPLSKSIFLEPANNEQQTKAIESAISNDITYIWGPPGTGKTTVIAQIIHNLYKSNRSVLLVSHTNTAVDGAINKASEKYGDKYPQSPYPLLRLGNAPEGTDERLLLETHIKAHGKELYERKAALEEEEKKAFDRLTQIENCFAKREWVSSSQLNTLENCFKQINQQEAEAGMYDRLISDVKAQMIKDTMAHPAYHKYNDLRKQADAAQQQHESCAKEMDSLNEKITALTQDEEKARNELALHDKKNALQQQIQSLPTSSSLSGAIQNVERELNQLEQQESNLSSALKDMEAQMTAYNQKSGLAKMFANKRNIEQLALHIHQTKQRIQEVKVQKAPKQKTLDDYKRQADALSQLQEELRLLPATNSKDYWRKHLAGIQSSRNETSKKLVKIEAAFKNAESHYKQLSARLEELQSIHVLIEQRNKELRQYTESSSTIRKRINELYRESDTVISSEKEKCAEWGHVFPESFDSDKVALQQAYLIQLRTSVKDEIRSCDFTELKAEQEKLEEEASRIEKELAEVRKQLLELEKQSILQAKVIGTTLAKSYLDDTLQERVFDTVIVDEASMASIPALWCACLMAEHNIVIVGDFLQLSPVVVANQNPQTKEEPLMAQKWLGSDIFLRSGMQERIKGQKTPPDNFVILNQQYRMESEIAEIANMYYGEYCRLRSDDHSDFRNKARDAFYEWYGGKRTKHSIHLMDTSSYHAWVTGVKQGKGHSRLNYFSAALDVMLAFSLIENKINEYRQVGKAAEHPVALIVVPYKPHAKLVEQYIEVQYKALGCENLNLVRAGTIHQFQGSEAEIVIFDFVIDEPHWKANLFMNTDEANASLEKMFNVAVTRAKFKLYLVGNFKYCRSRAKDNAFGALLEYLMDKQQFAVIDARAAFPRLAFAQHRVVEGDLSSNSKVLVCNEAEFSDYFIADLQRARQKAIIFSPFMTESRLSQLLPVFDECINRGLKIVVITKAPADRGKREFESYRKCCAVLREHGVEVIYKQNMHEKTIFIDEDVVWNGSLNALSFSGITGEIMQRVKERGVYEQHAKVIDLEAMIVPYVDISEQKQQKCPLCGGEMLVAEGKDGGFYWTCADCDYSRNPTQPYPEDGILRCAKCGSPFAFDMKKQPRWICSADSKHYQAIRSGDLKLPKMLSLIPMERYQEVNEYFKEKNR